MHAMQRSIDGRIIKSGEVVERISLNGGCYRINRSVRGQLSGQRIDSNYLQQS
jgi:hypothetical protein